LRQPKKPIDPVHEAKSAKGDPHECHTANPHHRISQSRLRTLRPRKRTHRTDPLRTLPAIPPQRRSPPRPTQSSRVNALYHTCIYALDTVARHIHAHAQEIDAALAAGSHEIVDKIAKVKVQGKVHNFFSFATKYCSWHQPERYPIYDSRVDYYLWSLQQQNSFAAAFTHPHLWDYPKFHKIVVTFRDSHGLSEFTFKEIDKFLYLQGERPSIPVPDEPQPGVGAFDFFPAQESSS
jgi:hypothetical protein